MKTHIIGFDIGGTKCTAVLADISDGISIIDRIWFQTPAGYPETRNLLFRHTYELLERFSLSPSNLIAAGLSCGGPLDSCKGIIQSPPNLPGWDNINICDDITREFGVPAYLQNDANACALVEWKIGAGSCAAGINSNNMIFLTMGTGFGAGIIAEGVLLNGANGMAGEVGHIRLKDNGPEGYGKSGSIEGFCSGAGIAKQAIEYTKEKLSTGITPKWIEDGIAIENISTKTIAEYANAGDPFAIEIFSIVGENLGRALAILIDAFNPQRIVIGSIFTRCEKFLRKSMQRAIDEEALSHSRKACEILPAKTGEDLGDLASILTACYYMGIDCAPITPKENTKQHFSRLFDRYPQLSEVKEKIMLTFKILIRAFRNKGKLLVCGNGGSAADADHIVGELMKGFYKKRPLCESDLQKLGNIGDKLQGTLQGTLEAISLTQHTALSTAIANDAEPSMVFAQQVLGYGKIGDVLLGLSTSGNSINVINAVKTAKALGLSVIGMTGDSGGEIASLCDVCINVPAAVTAEIQELHLPVYHTLCAMLEEEFFEN